MNLTGYIYISFLAEKDCTFGLEALDDGMDGFSLEREKNAIEMCVCFRVFPTGSIFGRTPLSFFVP